ncbi:MAG: PEP-CTERM sorting domain-containing protein [Opitutaceae bacterium]|jgi:hypothetical protein
MKPTPHIIRTLLGLGSLSLMAGSAVAQTTYTWVGGTDLNWSTVANWSSTAPTTVPGTTGTALLNDTGADRTIVYDSGASGALGTLTFTQTSAFINELNLKLSLTLTNALTLAASNGGTAQLSVSPSSSDLTLTASGGIDIQSGGKLALNFGSNVFNGSRTTTVTGNVTVSGGTLALGAMPTTQTSGSVNATINGNLTISSGSTIKIDNTTSGGQSGDVRLQVNGNFTATGGSLVADGSTKGLLSLNGAVNSMTNFSMTSTYGIQLGASGDQSLTGIPTNNSQLYMRGSGTKTIGSAVGGTISNLLFINSNTNGALVAMKLATDLTSSSGTQLLQLANGASSGTPANTALGVDVNGHTLDMTGATGASGNARGTTSGVWKPNHAGTATGTTWAISSSATGGRIRTLGYDFTGASVTTTVGANVTLEATGGNGIANNLGTGTALDVASTFDYTGNAVIGTPSTLASGRTIGALRVSKGVLAITGTNFTAASGITVDSGAVLDMSSQTVSATSLTLNLGGASAGQVKTTATYDYNANLTFNITSTPTVGVFDLFNGTTTGSGTTPSSISITGLLGSTSLTGAGVWTGTAGGYDFSFSETTGDLTVAVSAIPEPSTFAMLAGVMGLGLALGRRQRRV